MHLLQPITRIYPDYLHNSTELIRRLDSLHINDNIILISMDIVSLFPSIPQMECLTIIYEEMSKHQDLLLFDPNLIIQLLQINMFNNYFEFGNFSFKQITGIAMGSSFSPTVANIFMSVFLRNFLATITEKPLLILRYIDDIFLLWPKHQSITTFTSKINSFHPNIKFTIKTSNTTIDFLDITIYKGQRFASHQLLDTKTFQKPSNLYHYLHFKSNHPKSTFKSIITRECIRYARSNSNKQNYLLQVNLFRQRLLNRGYPYKFINKQIMRVNYNNRMNFLKPSENICLNTISHPIFKCLPPPKFKQLKKIILNRYNSISKIVKQPIFATLKHKTIGTSSLDLPSSQLTKTSWTFIFHVHQTTPHNHKLQLKY